ncbi:MAG: c-type cytochrome [Gammaproteobacteria bacterium]
MNRASHIGILALAVCAAAALAAGPASATPPAASPAWAARHFQNTCSSCHGADGAHPIPLPGNPPPILAGQYEDYLVQALNEYRDGQRRNVIMAPQAKALTEAQVKALAAYLSRLPGPLHTLPRPDFGH